MKVKGIRIDIKTNNIKPSEANYIALYNKDGEYINTIRLKDLEQFIDAHNLPKLLIGYYRKTDKVRGKEGNIVLQYLNVVDNKLIVKIYSSLKSALRYVNNEKVYGIYKDFEIYDRETGEVLKTKEELV